jgi:DNA-binding SARP family transcriptional activator
MQIELLGRPQITNEAGESQIVRGNQAWAVLARILLSPRPLSRRELAQEIMPDAADPLGALRWVLAALRKAIGADCLTGDPVLPEMPDGTRVDAFEIGEPGFDFESAGDFLEGLDDVGSSEFATWLLVERERLAARIDGALREEILNAIAADKDERAIVLAGLGARRRPYDEGTHVLLLRALVSAGNLGAAEDHLGKAEAMFIDELGEPPSPALRSAARVTIAAPPQGLSSAAVIDSLIQSGNAALSAGVVDAGIDCLRRAVAEAERIHDRHAQARGLTELGTALIHSARGYDDEGSVHLRVATELARESGDGRLAGRALQVLGYADALAGRRPAAASTLEQAYEAANDEADDLANVLAFRAFNLVDWGRHEEGVAEFERAIEIARSSGNRRREVWALGLGGWGQRQAGAVSEAEDWLKAAVRLSEDLMWLAFRPWPMAVLAETNLRQLAPPEAIRVGLEAPFALSCQLGDPCWEAATARSTALAFEESGAQDAAWDWIGRAERACLRVTDPYAALHVAILADRARLAEARGDAEDFERTARRYLATVARTHADAHLETAMSLVGRTGRHGGFSR